MLRLLNVISAQEAVDRLAQEPFARRTLSFYRYVTIEDPKQLRDDLFVQWEGLGVLGRTYLATEGVNAQVSVPEPRWDAFVSALYAHSEFSGVPFKIALEESAPSFFKLVIKVRKQIVADGLTPDDYDLSNVGTRLEPKVFHQLLSDPEAVVVDMRNHYESEVGRFEGAICPQVDTFREELPTVRTLLEGQENKKVLLYCTGGIRCEKASAYLKHHGFKDVYQLHGGVIAYAQFSKNEGVPSKFKGKNFVFDERLGERVTEDVLSRCHLCDAPCDTHNNCANEVCNVLFIQCEGCHTRLEGTCSETCQQMASLPEEERQVLRKTHRKAKNFSRYLKSSNACSR